MLTRRRQRRRRRTPTQRRACPTGRRCSARTRRESWERRNPSSLASRRQTLTRGRRRAWPIPHLRWRESWGRWRLWRSWGSRWGTWTSCRSLTSREPPGLRSAGKVWRRLRCVLKLLLVHFSVTLVHLSGVWQYPGHAGDQGQSGGHHQDGGEVHFPVGGQGGEWLSQQ